MSGRRHNHVSVSRPAIYRRPPAIHIEIPFEGHAVTRFHALNEADLHRLRAWARSRPAVLETLGETVRNAVDSIEDDEGRRAA